MADQQYEAFVRQRRNLIIVSLVILFSEAIELKVEKVSAFGNEVLIGQPQTVTTALWVAAMYWLIRFYQYSRATHKGSLKNIIQSYIEKYEVIWPVIQRRLKKDDATLVEPIGGIEGIPKIECTMLGNIQYRHNYLEADISLVKTTNNEFASVTQRLGNRTVRVDGADLFWLHLRAWIYLILHTTLFTELVLPYLVFTLPILYAGYKAIHQMT